MNEVQGYLSNVWWLLLTQAVALLLLGVAVVVWPGLTLALLAVLFAAYLLVVGVSTLIGAVAGGGSKSMWFLDIIIGVGEVAISVYIFKNELVLSTFILVAGLFFVVRGILDLIASLDSASGQHRALSIVSSVLSIIAGFIILRNPVSSGIVFVWVLGLYAIIAGVIGIAQVLRARSLLEA